MKDQELYINDKLVDMSDDSLLLFTYQRSDSTSPTAIKNSYTKTVVLPGTPTNNIVFDSIFKMDRYQTKVIFDPSKRVKFELFKDGCLVENGYVKLNKINKANNYCSYEITLYGGLGDFFYGLSYNEDGTSLNLGDLEYDVPIEFRINTTAVYEAWYRLKNNLDFTSWGPETTHPTYIDYPSEEVYFNWQFDTINFAPAYNGYPNNDGFDSAKVLVSTEAHNPKSGVNNRIGAWIDGDEGGYEEITNWPKRYPLDNREDETATSMYSSEGNGWGLIEMDEEATEWEVRDLRSYMQRPVLRVKKLFEAIQRYAELKLDYTLYLDPEFFNTDNEYYNDSWITLGLLCENKEDVKTNDKVVQKMKEEGDVEIFGGTESPFQYLVSFAKMFDLHFDYDKINRKVSLLKRSNYYIPEIVDLDEKLDRTNASILPLNFDFKWLKLTYKDSQSQLLDFYNKYYKFEYGALRKDTGYDFDSSTHVEPEDIIFENAVDALEKSTYFRDIYSAKNEYHYGTPTNNRLELSVCVYPTFFNKKGTTYSLFSKDTDESGAIGYNTESREIHKQYDSMKGTQRTGTTYRIFSQKLYLKGYENELYDDAFPKPQFHDDSNGAIDGKNVLLFYNNFCEPRCYNNPRSSIPANAPYTLTDDVQSSGEGYVGMKELLDDNRCWVYPVIQHYSPGSIGSYWDNGDPARQYTIYSMPMFCRNKYDFDTMEITSSFDFTVPEEIYVPKFTEERSSTVARKAEWIRFLEDFYSPNTREFTCDVMITDITDALRKIYYFDDSYWIIKKIQDYSYDNKFAKITFIKVNAITNYTKYLIVGGSDITVPSSGGNFKIFGSFGGYDENPTVKLSDSWLSCNITTSDYDYTLEFTVSENTSESPRETTVIIEYGDIERKLRITQLGKDVYYDFTVNVDQDNANINIEVL